MPYQTIFPDIPVPKFNLAPNNTKVKFEKDYTYMPLINDKVNTILKKVIKLYNRYIGKKLYSHENDQCRNVLTYLIDKNISLYPWIIGGYPDYANTDYYVYKKKSKESLIKLMDSEIEISINVLISRKDLENKNFSNAELVYED